ncbi:MAG: BMC domain-containing protein [Candidatus Eisenbacteria bacterium]
MNHVTIAALECSSIAQGIVAADAMLKAAHVELVECCTLSPGRYWVLIAGDLAAVRASHRRGVDVAGETLLDQIFITQLHEQVLPALRGRVATSSDDALGVIETLTAASAILAADIAGKAARIHLRDIRLANGIGGKGVVTLTGTVSAVQAAIEAGKADAAKRGLLARAVVVPRLDARLRDRIG